MIKLSPFQWSAFNFFGFYCAFGVLTPFLPVWLKSYDYSVGQIGLIVASGYLFRFCGGMLFSRQIRSSAGLLPMTRRLAWGSLLAVAIMSVAVQNIWLLLPAIALFHIISGGSMPINETIASTWQQQVGMDYGKARLFGSIAFVIGSISTGYLAGWLGEQNIIWIMASFILMLSLGQMLPPSQPFQERTQKNASSVSYGQILRNATTARILIAVSLIQSGHAAYYAYSTIYWQSAGISTQSASLLWGLGVIAEICLFFIARRAFSTQKIATLMTIAALGAIMRWCIVASTTALLPLAASQLLHALSFGLSHYAMVRYISTQSVEIMPKLQGLYFGLASCAFTALFVLLSGLIYPYSPEGIFWLMVGVVVTALPFIPHKMPAKLS